MKASLVLILAASAAVVGGCARSPNPAVVSTPAVIERTQVQTQAAGATAAPSACTWASQSFSSGATSCQNHQTYQCSNGSWQLQSAPAC